MPKLAEFDKAARSIVAYFPIAKDSSSTADKILYSSWHDGNSNVGRLLNYVRDRRSDEKKEQSFVATQMDGLIDSPDLPQLSVLH
jgi:hypothetical protein